MIALLDLAEITPADRPRVGGKAAGLAALARRRIPVPPGFVVPTDAFVAAIRAAGLSGEATAVRQGAPPDRLREGLEGLALPVGLAGELVVRARALGASVAVRSSAVDEDGRVQSFAGQHATVLEVAPEAVPDAVRAVWASLYGAAALAYRGRRGPDPGAMAVLVQRMVSPRVSGVMFTVNPLSGSWREMTVEATWGLGEALVAGQVTPHWYLVRRPRRVPRLLSRARLRLVQRDLPDIAERSEVVDGEVVRGPVPPALRHRATLDRPHLLELCELGLRVESEMGEPQDVEWALDAQGRIHVLQARPITTAATPRGRRDVLWTRRFVGERWHEPATPLGWSLIAPVLEHFIAYPETQGRYLGGGPALRLVRSRPYVNATAFRHLAFKLPGAPAPRFMLELVPPEEEWDWQRRFAVLPDASVYASFFRETVLGRRWRRFRWNPLTNHRHWEAFSERLEGELPGLSRLPVSPRDALRLVRSQRDLVREYVGIHICSLLFANLFYQLLEAALAGWAPEEAPSLMARLAVTPPGNRTLETNEALWELATIASPADLSALERGEAPSERFRAALEELLARYGHRSHASWEVMAERWVENPARLVPLLRPGGEEPAARARRQEQAHAEALAQMRGAVGPTERAALEILVHYTRRYLLLRENQRFLFDRLLFAMKRSLLWLGGWFVQQGQVDEEADVAFLTWDEVVGLASETLPPEPVREWVARRRAQREEDLREEPPVFLHGDEGAPAPLDQGLRMQGLGISNGRVRGRVRVLRNLAEGAKLQAGEILVAHAVDPAWTPLLLTAGGVILEMGSRLSHGAVIAREYGVPAVVNLEGVTRRLRDGQEVTVDGTRGMVWLHP